MGKDPAKVCGKRPGVNNERGAIERRFRSLRLVDGGCQVEELHDLGDARPMRMAKSAPHLNGHVAKDSWLIQRRCSIEQLAGSIAALSATLSPNTDRCLAG